MRILLTNDDGLFAPGLAAIHQELLSFGQVSVVAPEECQSASGHSLTVREALVCSRQKVNHNLTGWAVRGRPADCVKLAIRELLDSRPDLVVSGINAGANVGINVIYSGTVAAAVEAAFFRIPAVAFSLEMGEEQDEKQINESLQRAAVVAGQNTRHCGCCVRAFGPSFHGWMSAIRTSLNPAGTVDGGIPSLLLAGCAWPAATDPHR